MKKEQIVTTLKDKKFIIGLAATLSIVLVGSFVVNALNPYNHFDTMGERKYGGNHQEQDNVNHQEHDNENRQFEEINLDDIYDEYSDDELDTGLDIGASAALQDTDLTLEDMLTYAIQDEYLAKAEYDYIIDEFGSQRPFSNIVNAEVNHIELLTPLLEKYATVPENNAEDVVIKVTDLRDAFEAGVKAEIANIKMYEIFLKEDLPDDVKVVFDELLNGSQNHLEAFSRGLNRR
jgi:hypothetical protein